MHEREQEIQSAEGMTALLDPMRILAADAGRRPDKRRLIRRILFGAVAFLTAFLLLLAACQVGNDPTQTTSTVSGSTTDATVRPNFLGSYTLAQRVAESINQQSQVASIFQSIPDAQRHGILLDEYVQYIRLLRRMTNGTISSLTRISNGELSQLLQNLRFAADLKHEGFYFQPAQTSDPSQRVAYFQQIDPEGTPYLDRTPIVRVLSLQNYAALYFDAIDRSDRDALAVLIRSGADTQEARLEKADRILTFYHREVATASPAFRLAMVMPDRLTFVQSVYQDAARTQVGTRHMTIYADGAAGFVIDDPIPDTLNLADFRISADGRPVFDFVRLQNGRQSIVTSSLLYEIAGEAILHDDTTCTPLSDGDNQMTAYYNGITVEGTGRCDQHKYWRMRITRLTLTDSKYQTGSGLSVGQPLNSLLLNYPFADEYSGVIEGVLAPYRMKLAFDVDNKTIRKITVTISDN